MARIPFRLYGKKRGDRRTGSKSLGNAGEALFFGFFFSLGCFALLWMLFHSIIPEWHVSHGFVKTTCRVLQRRLISRPGDGGVHFRPDVKIQYDVDGKPVEMWTYDIGEDFYPSREQAQKLLDAFVEGKEYDCWYDPADPHTAVVVHGYSAWLWLAVLVPISFIVIGGGGWVWAVFHWGKSAEHRSAAATRVAAMNPLQEEQAESRRFPYVPRAAPLRESPGTSLAYRLPASTSPGWRLFALGASSVIWNGLVISLLALFLSGAIAADPAWPFWLCLSLAILAGWGLVFLFVRQLLLTSGVGPTFIEISNHPLSPGKSYDLLLSQNGRVSMRSLELYLICEEQSTYRQGTDTRTERRRVFQQSLWRREDFQIEQGENLEARCPLSVPPLAMHSFQGAYNEVQWRLIVLGDVVDWPGFERAFPIVVQPSRKQETT